MGAVAQELSAGLAQGALPRILFVLGKGGVGRSTASAALARALTRRGERVLVLEWAVADPVGPWFGLPPAGPAPMEVAPGLAVANFTLQEALRAYFVDHLHLGLLYRRVIRSEQVRRLIAVAPGISEIFFLGELWWLTALAAEEAGLQFDRFIVDAPATGHGASLLDVPTTLAAMGATGPLALEVGRVQALMADPARVGALALTLPEPLPAEETAELVPRIRARLGRPPLALVVNRSAGGVPSGPRRKGLSPAAGAALDELEVELRARRTLEATLRASLGPETGGFLALPELLELEPRALIDALADAFSPALGAPA